MDDPLRERRAVIELAEKRQVIEISEKIGNFKGLSKVLEAELAVLDAATRPKGWRENRVAGRLAFDFADAQPKAAALTETLHGQLNATIVAVCQRCLNAFEWPLTCELKLQFALPHRSCRERQGYEIWELADTSVSPIEIVEEALIMTLPLVARHVDMSECVEFRPASVDERLTTPFATLRAQMDDDIE